MNDEQKELALSILQYHGVSSQKTKAIEELSELIGALVRYQHRGWEGALRDAVIDEMADVKIMIEQMENIFDRELVNKRVDEKLSRELGRIAIERG